MKNRMQFEKGQSILEVLVAMSAAVIVMTAITTVVVAALRNAQVSRNQNQAAQYAQEGMEYVRQLKLRNYTYLRGIGGGSGDRFCFGENASAQTDPAIAFRPIGDCASIPNIGSTFIRHILFERNRAPCRIDPPYARNDEVKTVTVTVLWRDGSCTAGNYCKSTQIISCITPYNILPAP